MIPLTLLDPGAMDGSISHCQKAECDFPCCKRTGHKGIALLPGEWEQIRPEQRRHLLLLEADFHGGKLVACRAHHTATCDGGYKPVDCRLYPLWPRFDEDGTLRGWDAHLNVEKKPRSSKCPLQANQLAVHVQKAGKYVVQLAEDPSMREFFNAVPAIGYTTTFPVEKAGRAG